MTVQLTQKLPCRITTYTLDFQYLIDRVDGFNHKFCCRGDFVTTKTIVVCGATGSQGGAVVDSLLKREGYHVVAFSRQPTGQKAQVLRDRGVEVHAGDLLDRDFLLKVFAGADGVFGVTQPWSPDHKQCNIESERIQGRNIVDACKVNQVPHLVLSSVINLSNQPTGVPHADSKLEIEQYCQASQVQSTVVQLSSFLDNLGGPFFPITKRTIRGFVDRDAKVGYIACRDIGEVTATVFERPEKYQNQVVRLIADFVSGDDIVAALAQLTGRRRWYWAPPRWVMRIMAPEFLLMRQTMEEYGRPPKSQLAEDMVAACRAEFPDLWCLEDFLRSQGDGNTL
jgi:uncharacterized protein YbjT (DUF2867 family)